MLRRQEQQALVDRYIQGYREQPESDDEIAEVHRTSLAALAKEPIAALRPHKVAQLDSAIRFAPGLED